MDEIQKVLVKMGRKDLAQKYYKKIAADMFKRGDKVIVTKETEAKVFKTIPNTLSEISSSNNTRIVKVDETGKFYGGMTRTHAGVEMDEGDFIIIPVNSIKKK